MIDLTGKLVLVSGGARDIGRACVVELARAGADVAFTCSATSPDMTCGAVSELKRTAWGQKVDAFSLAGVSDFVKAATERFGKPVYGLVHNTGGLVARKKIEEMDEAHWDYVMDLNAKTVFLLTKAALPRMSDGGSIVVNASQAARDGGGPGATAYAASKGALLSFTRGIAKELGPRRIRANAVCPGMIATVFHDNFTKPEVRQRVAGMTPLGREGEAIEVAHLVTYLISDKSSFINGASIDINGGLAFS